MSLSLVSNPGHAPSPGLTAARAWAASAPVLAVVTALALGYGLTGSAGVLVAPPDTAVLLGVVAAAVSALLLVFGVVTRSARRRKLRTQESLAWIEQLHLCGSPDDLLGARPAPVIEIEGQEAPQVRALRLHVRTLETALEEQTVRLAQLNKSMNVQRDGDLERVLVAVEALRGRVTGDQEPLQVLDRVKAAVSRLDAPRAAARPTLPAPVASSAAAAPTPARPAAPHPSMPQHPAAQLAAALPEVVQPQAMQPEPAPTPTDDVVLPVPAPPQQESQRPRRRLRRRAA